MTLLWRLDPTVAYLLSVFFFGVGTGLLVYMFITRVAAEARVQDDPEKAFQLMRQAHLASLFGTLALVVSLSIG